MVSRLTGTESAAWTVANLGTSVCDCSGLAVWHAYLPNVPLPHTNCANADLWRSQLTDAFGAVFAVAFSPDGTHFVTGELGGYLRLWSVSDGQATWTVKACNSRIHSIVLSPDGTIVAVGAGDRTIELWEAATGKHVRALAGHRDQIYGVAFPRKSCSRLPAVTIPSASGISIWESIYTSLRETADIPIKCNPFVSVLRVTSW